MDKLSSSSSSSFFICTFRSSINPSQTESLIKSDLGWWLLPFYWNQKKMILMMFIYISPVSNTNQTVYCPFNPLYYQRTSRWYHRDHPPTQTWSLEPSCTHWGLTGWCHCSIPRLNSSYALQSLRDLWYPTRITSYQQTSLGSTLRASRHTSGCNCIGQGNGLKMVSFCLSFTSAWQSGRSLGSKHDWRN